MDTWELVDAERTDFADLADSLTPAQWDAPSLCTAWKVRDVVAHVKRVKGLHLKATDLDWEHGDAGGAEVTGTGEAILMAMAGRPAALDDLSGPGVAQLRERISA